MNVIDANQDLPKNVTDKVDVAVLDKNDDVSSTPKPQETNLSVKAPQVKTLAAETSSNDFVDTIDLLNQKIAYLTRKLK